MYKLYIYIYIYMASPRSDTTTSDMESPKATSPLVRQREERYSPRISPRISSVSSQSTKGKGMSIDNVFKKENPFFDWARYEKDTPKTPGTPPGSPKSHLEKSILVYCNYPLAGNDAKFGSLFPGGVIGNKKNQKKNEKINKEDKRR